MPIPRRYEIEQEPDLCWRRKGYARPTSIFVLRCWGDGHWCLAEGGRNHFDRRDDAVLGGQLWVETGLPPCEQTPERIAARREAQAPRLERAA
jgi:hypothetical protein